MQGQGKQKINCKMFYVVPMYLCFLKSDAHSVSFPIELRYSAKTDSSVWKIGFFPNFIANYKLTKGLQRNEHHFLKTIQ